jgi:hypothetical protein
MGFKLFAIRREDTEAATVAWNQMAEGAKDVVETERMNGAYVKVDVVTWLDVMPKSHLDLVDGSVGVRYAGDGAWCVTNDVDSTG